MIMQSSEYKTLDFERKKFECFPSRAQIKLKVQAVWYPIYLAFEEVP